MAAILNGGPIRHNAVERFLARDAISGFAYFDQMAVKVIPRCGCEFGVFGERLASKDFVNYARRQAGQKNFPRRGPMHGR